MLAPAEAEWALTLILCWCPPQEYPADEILLVYDKDFKYGHNFYLIGTEEGKENYFKVNELQGLAGWLPKRAQLLEHPWVPRQGCVPWAQLQNGWALS